MLVGYSAGLQGTSQDWLSALYMAVNGQCPHGARDQRLALMRDHGCQPTSLAFMRACATWEIHQAFTSDNNLKGHADIDREIRTLKEECLWLQPWTSPVTLARALATWIDDDNEHDLHSVLGYKPARPFERDDHLSHRTQLPAA